MGLRDSVCQLPKYVMEGSLRPAVSYEP